MLIVASVGTRSFAALRMTSCKRLRKAQQKGAAVGLSPQRNWHLVAPT